VKATRVRARGTGLCGSAAGVGAPSEVMGPFRSVSVKTTVGGWPGERFETLTIFSVMASKLGLWTGATWMAAMGARTVGRVGPGRWHSTHRVSSGCGPPGWATWTRSVMGPAPNQTSGWQLSQVRREMACSVAEAWGAPAWQASQSRRSRG
jgi:hypothetical protein